MCVSGGKKCLLFEKFGVLCFLETPVLRFGLLSHYRRFHLFAGNISHLIATTIERMVKGETIQNEFLGNRKIESTKYFCGKHCKKKWSFPLRISSVNMTKFPDLVTFTDEILNGKLHFSLSKNISNNIVVVMAFKFLSVNLTKWSSTFKCIQMVKQEFFIYSTFDMSIVAKNRHKI